MRRLPNRITSWWRGLDSHRIEATGAFILLVAAMWEALALRHADEQLWQWVNADINDKLKHLFTALGSDDTRAYVRAHTSDFLAGSNSTIDYYEDARRSLSLSILGVIRGALFVAGSILVVVGKWRQGNAHGDGRDHGQTEPAAMPAKPRAARAPATPHDDGRPS